jgi:hypothetical protein
MACHGHLVWIVIAESSRRPTHCSSPAGGALHPAAKRHGVQKPTKPQERIFQDQSVGYVSGRSDATDYTSRFSR